MKAGIGRQTRSNKTRSSPLHRGYVTVRHCMYCSSLRAAADSFKGALQTANEKLSSLKVGARVDALFT